jgi:HEAT repeat protein
MTDFIALRRAALGGAMLTLAVASTAAAQADLVERAAPLAQRVAAARDGTVRLTFALRPGVCGQGTNLHIRSVSSSMWNDDSRNRDVEWNDECESGPGRLALDVEHGEVRAARFYVGGRWKPAASDVTDFGAVSAPQAAGFLLGLAERGSGKVSREAVFRATLADSTTTWPVLLRLAKDERLDKETRSQAVFWLSSQAGDAATKGLVELTDDGQREIRDQAVFALSRRPADDGVPALIRIARTHRDPQLRRSAMFWLGRSKDPRALALFEELLTAK